MHSYAELNGLSLYIQGVLGGTFKQAFFLFQIRSAGFEKYTHNMPHN